MISKNNRRIDYLDFAKAISILCMVWSHVGTKFEITDLYIHVFHMPIFFILSGWCFNSNLDFKAFTRKKIASLIRPYFIYGTFIYFLWNFIYSLLNMHDRKIPLKTFLQSILYLNADISPYACVQWFFTALFFANIIFYFIVRICKKDKRLIMVFCIIIGIVGWILSSFGRYILPYRLPLSIDVAFMGTLFMGIGYILKEKELRYFHALLFVPITIITVWLNSKSTYNMRIMNYGNPIFYLLASVSMSLTIILFSKLFCLKIERKIIRGLLYVGRNSIWYLVFNQLFIRGIRLIAESVDIVIPNIVIILLVTVMMLPATVVGNKFLSWSIGRT